MRQHLAPLIVSLAVIGAIGGAGAAAPVGAQSTSAMPTGGTHVDTSIVRRLAELPTELDLADGDLRVVNLYKLQAQAFAAAAAGEPTEAVVDRMVREIYAPYAAFWNGYLGDEAKFRAFSEKLLGVHGLIESRIVPLLDVGLDRRFIEGVAWIERTAGRRPKGTWYLAFGPGWTDMGGLGEIGMVADFTSMEPDSAAIADILPHELTHQVHGAAPGRANDPDAGTVLERIVGEGFATYVAWVYAGGARTPAQALGYDEAEWRWALAHERELWDAARPILGSRERAASDRVANRGQQLIAGAPGAAGYFLGFRIVEAYVARHGAESWKEIYDLPVRAVLERSGYGR